MKETLVVWSCCNCGTDNESFELIAGTHEFIDCCSGCGNLHNIYVDMDGDVIVNEY